MNVVYYRNRTNGEFPIGLSQIRNSVPILFGSTPTQEILDLANVDPVYESSQPAYDSSKEYISEREPKFINNRWYQSWEIKALEVFQAPVVTYKGDVWRRVTVEQANQLDTEIQKLGVRERNLWSDSLHLDHSDPFFIMLREEMLSQWGQAETDRILAPSEG